MADVGGGELVLVAIQRLLNVELDGYTRITSRIMASPSTKRGAFIVVEGLDRSGKTTQTAILRDRLANEGHPVKLYKFPGLYLITSIHIYARIIIIVSRLEYFQTDQQ